MSLTSLHYANEAEWKCLPDWACFFLSLGAFVAAQPKSETRAIVGVAIPTRAYAAALAAVGVVYHQTRTRNDSSAESHFHRLCELQRGTGVTYLQGTRSLDGVLLGCTDQFGERRLIVQTRNPRAGGDTHYVAARDAIKIQLPAEADTIVSPQDLPERQTGRLVAPVCPFTRCFLGEDAVKDFALRSRLDCLIVGRLSLLRQEILETIFRSFLSGDNLPDSADETHEGALVDILRVGKFMSEGKAYRSDAVAANSSGLSEAAYHAVPHVAVFDGPAGFSKWRHCWRASHLIVLLDGTESGFDEAARIVNAEHSNRVDDDMPTEFPAPPDGIETVFYRERLR